MYLVSVIKKRKLYKNMKERTDFFFLKQFPVFLLLRSEGGFRQSDPLDNIELRVDLPPSMSVCDIGTLTVWCRQASVIFSTLPIPAAAFVSVN